MLACHSGSMGTKKRQKIRQITWCDLVRKTPGRFISEDVKRFLPTFRVDCYHSATTPCGYNTLPYGWIYVYRRAYFRFGQMFHHCTPVGKENEMFIQSPFQILESPPLSISIHSQGTSLYPHISLIPTSLPTSAQPRTPRPPPPRSPCAPPRKPTPAPSCCRPWP